MKKIIKSPRWYKNTSQTFKISNYINICIKFCSSKTYKQGAYYYFQYSLDLKNWFSTNKTRIIKNGIYSACLLSNNFKYIRMIYRGFDITNLSLITDKGTRR